MIFLFLALISSHKILGIDFGTQYLKYSYADIDTKETHLGDYPPTRGIPTAFAIKTKKNSNVPLTNETLNGISLKFGQKAISYLKKHPQHGSDSILNSVTRNLTEYNSLTLVNQTTLLSLYFVEFLKSLREQPDFISLNFPAFFTPSMRQKVASSVSFFRIPLKHVSDDVQAISSLYSDTYLNRFQNSPRQVLFIDIGYSYAKFYVINFTFNSNHSLAQTVVYDWSEKCSGHGFAQALSKSARLPIHTAEKMLRDVTDDVDFAKEEISELKRLINQTVEMSGLVDEAQILGGASKYPFVYDAVSDAAKYIFKPKPTPKPVKHNITKTEINQTEANQTETNQTEANQTETNQTEANQTETNETAANQTETNETVKAEEQSINNDQTSAEKVGTEDMTSTGFTSIESNSTNTTTVNETEEEVHVVLRELDPVNSIALGMAHLMLTVENASMFNPTFMRKRPTASYYYQCGPRREKMCQKNAICREPVISRMAGCPNDIIEILIDKRQTPLGTPEVIGKYRMTNISNIEFNNGTDQSRCYLRIRSPEPSLEQVLWCNESAKCFDIELQDVTNADFISASDFEMFKAITDRFGVDAITQDYLDQIKGLIKKIKKAIKPSDSESSVKIDHASREKFNEIKKQFEFGELAKLGKEKIMEARDELKSIVLGLGIKAN